MNPAGGLLTGRKKSALRTFKQGLRKKGSKPRYEHMSNAANEIWFLQTHSTEKGFQIGSRMTN